MNNRKHLDLTTQGIKELFFALKKLPGKTPSTALEVMLGYGYADEELFFLCNNQYIKYTEYTEAVFDFRTKPS